MAGDVDSSDTRYWGFISYSHRDEAFGQALHRKLERYRIPSRLVGRATAHGTVPRSLAPIFRDRVELAAANDLSTEVRAALKASRSLIVVCSPAAAASPWVGREIDLFRSLHPDRPILTAIRDGEPADCFPPGLLRPGTDGQMIEPLAADFRSGRDGEHLGLLKLVAGIIGIGLDELIRRDAQRNMRRVTAIMAASLVAVLVMAALSLFALNARNEAEHQRAEAEGLVEFMLTDLRDKLKGVGRLDVMTAVNERALHYYESQDNLTDNALAQNAAVLDSLGDDDEQRGLQKSASKKFQEAFAITSKLLANDEKNTERSYDHSQSEYWLGFDEYQRGHYSSAQKRFSDYKILTRRLIANNPHSTRYWREASYADGDLCSVALASKQPPQVGIKLCETALAEMELAAKTATNDQAISSFERHKVPSDLVNRHAWLGDAFLYAGDLMHALRERLIEERLLSAILKRDPRNMDLKTDWVALQRSLARIETRNGQISRAHDRLKKTSLLLDEMVAFDPQNESWQDQRRRLTLENEAVRSLQSNPN